MSQTLSKTKRPTISFPNTKEGRRARIIDEARRLISDQGFEALSLRKLATAASVTVPTIYNLIGSKEDILMELFHSWISLVEDALDKIDENRPLDLAEAVITEATGLIEMDEPYFRATHIAMRHLENTERHRKDFDQFAERASNMQTKAVRLAQRQGLLKGDIRPKTLGRHIYLNYSEASHRWVDGSHSLVDFRRQALAGVYLHFLSDAEEGFRPILLKKLKQVT